MTGSTRPLRDCPDPCACYAEGYAAGCSCEPCLATRAVRDAAILENHPGKSHPNQPCAHPSTRAIVGVSLSKG